MSCIVCLLMPVVSVVSVDAHGAPDVLGVCDAPQSVCGVWSVVSMVPGVSVWMSLVSMVPVVSLVSVDVLGDLVYGS